ncbi:HNH endonuclease [Providencia rettgeri]|uniref:HNH endonuclease n=1 Tax=Providencia rettgeri TaxID=587 RepID=UPI002362C21B|nr:HNH endonuclease [Providencia rettgeri]
MFTREYLLSLERRIPLMDRISRKIKINKNGCHEFTGSKDRCGYGRMKVGKHSLGAHKVLFLLVHGDYDQSKLEVMHSCDNPACVNIEHLSIGTHKENIYDCIFKGRHAYQNGILNKFIHYKKTNANLSGIIIYKSSRSLALDNGDRNYAGSLCKKHQSTIRRASNGQCIYCYNDYLLKRRAKRENQKITYSQ